MRLWRTASLVALPILLLVSGCGYVHVGRLPSPVTTVVGDDKLMKDNADLKLEKKILQQELALERSQGAALRSALENRAADGGDTKRLVEQLSQRARELTALRTSYAQLQTERNQAVATAAGAAGLKARLGAAEEQLASTLRNYTQLQGEITQLRGEIDRTRAENVALTEQVKVITSQNEQAQTALTQLNSDLLAQKDARLRAEQDATTLRTELKAVAPDASILAQQRTGAAADARSLAAEHAAETAALKQQLDTLRTKVDTLAAEREKLTQQVAAVETTPRVPAAELANMEAKLSSALESATQLRTENTQLKTQLVELKQGTAGSAGAQSLQDQLRDTQSQAAFLVEENARLKARLGGASSGAPAAPTTSTSVVSSGAAAPAGVVTIKSSSVNATLVTSVSSASRPAAATASEPTGIRFHVVAEGDTLKKISAKYYGTDTRYSDILAANRDVIDSNGIVIGRTLRIP